MVLPARGSGASHLQGVMEYGTMLEIQSVQMLPDGRSMVETVGTHRFRLLEKGNLDGYTVGRIERIDDISPEDESMMEREAVARALSKRTGRSTPAGQGGSSNSAAGQTNTSSTSGSSGNASTTIPILPEPTYLPLAIPLPPDQSPPSIYGNIPGPTLSSSLASAAGSGEETPQTTQELMQICKSFIEQLRSGSAPWLLQRLNNTYGSMPSDPSEFSYWMALVGFLLSLKSSSLFFFPVTCHLSVLYDVSLSR